MWVGYWVIRLLTYFGQKKYIKMNNLYQREPKIPEYRQVLEVFIRGGGNEVMATAFYNKYDALGWYLGNTPIINFVGIANNFIRNWKENEDNKRSIAAKNRGFQQGRAAGEGDY